MAKEKKSEERRHGDKVYRDGKMYGNYAVYDDGRIEMSPWRESMNGLRATENAIWDMEKSFERLVFERRRDLQEQIIKYWRSFSRELKLIDPTFDEDKWTYGIDGDGYVTKTAKPEPAKADEQKTAA